MTSPRLVLDTNTVLALWLFRDPALAALGALIEGGGCTLHSRGDALEELRHVLAYPQFQVATAEQQALRTAYEARLSPAPGALAADPAALPACRDADDQKFLEIARDAAASHLLTRDKALLRLARHRLVRGRFAILTPERFLSPRPPG
jgi:putative PIN family toxin of toxin-antitoxin system